jgi:transcriptional regulator with XRE-family HTH domain
MSASHDIVASRSSEPKTAENQHVLTPREKIKIALIRRGWKVEDLAKKCGLAVTYVRQVVNGVFMVKPAREKIEAACGEKFWTEER